MKSLQHYNTVINFGTKSLSTINPIKSNTFKDRITFFNQKKSTDNQKKEKKPIKVDNSNIKKN